MKSARSWPAAGLAVLLAASSVALAARGDFLPSRPDVDPFPHEEHRGLFPTCLGCHAGVATGDETTYYSVSQADCASCHDGIELEEVEWAPPEREVAHLTFSHPGHEEALRAEGAEPALCQDCHGRPDAVHRMDVAAADAASCFDCHEAAPEGHLAESTVCSTCHAPLARADEAVTVERVAAFPVPADHETPDFIFHHDASARAELGRCSTCHARESCTRCHINADRLPEVAELGEDARDARVAADRPPRWPLPESHERRDFMRTHGALARAELSSCANCHAPPSCEACHGAGEPALAAELPRPAPDHPQGVRTDVIRPPGHTPDFAERHGAAAAANLPNCSSCHQESHCAECHLSAAGPEPTGGEDYPRSGSGVEFAEHGGSGTRETGAAPVQLATFLPLPPFRADTLEVRTDTLEDDGRDDSPRIEREPDTGFHPRNFVSRHGAEAFAAPMECTQCHSQEAFCQDCHASSGMAAEERRAVGGFHDATTDWLISHGRAARLSMEACASCHQQTSCLQCHSAREGGMAVNPHGPDFDAERLARRAGASCAICHTSDQVLPR